MPGGQLTEIWRSGERPQMEVSSGRGQLQEAAAREAGQWRPRAEPREGRRSPRKPSALRSGYRAQMDKPDLQRREGVAVAQQQAHRVPRWLRPTPARPSASHLASLPKAPSSSGGD